MAITLHFARSWNFIAKRDVNVGLCGPHEYHKPELMGFMSATINRGYAMGLCHLPWHPLTSERYVIYHVIYHKPELIQPQ